MRRELIPYYASRTVLSALIGLLLALGGMSWWASALTGLLTFTGFLWYARSGRYLIDPSNPLIPLRRDDRGKAIRDRAVVVAVVVGGISYGILTLLGMVWALPPNVGAWALLTGIAAYFITSNWLYVKG
jgi:hypothetical protein